MPRLGLLTKVMCVSRDMWHLAIGLKNVTTFVLYCHTSQLITAAANVFSVYCMIGMI